MDNELIKKIVEYIENASPQMWRIAGQQVEVEIWQSWWWAIAFGIVAIVFLTLSIAGIVIWFKSRIDGDKDNSWWGLVAFFLFIATFPTMASAYNYVQIVSMQMNPEYYAVRVLLGLVK